MEKRHVSNLNEAKSLINLAMITGQMLIKNGAEIYRAEDTIERMCACVEEIREVEVFALSSAIFVSTQYEGETITMFKDIESQGVHLSRIHAINAFSRKFVSGSISLSDARKELLSIAAMDKCPLALAMFFTGLCSASFAIMFGGDLYDFGYTFFVGSVLSYFLRITSNYDMSFFPETFLGTMIISILAFIGASQTDKLHMDMIIIGSIMPLVPGLAVTNALRDIISGDFVSGMIGITKGIFVALAIALGVGFILNIQKMIGG
ncbi:MAG: threonine/serine exporter family protein [Peptoniphilus sp.]|nr:threonine/serine exporter family protein [Peptoniphilus sp.]MDY3119181.1 threonine/serine exporter family protein [Peptoniphilus sp.]